MAVVKGAELAEWRWEELAEQLGMRGPRVWPSNSDRTKSKEWA